MVICGPLSGGWEPTPVDRPPAQPATPTSRPSGVLQVDQHLTTEQAQALREHWCSAAGNAPLVLGPVSRYLASGEAMREPLTDEHLRRLLGPDSASDPILAMADPFLLDCLCWRCSRGGRCASMAKLHREHAARIDRAEKIAALLPQDRAWLTAHGWDGT